MRLHTQHQYSADPGTVFTMLTDEAFLRAKLEARGERNVEVVECRETPEGYRIVTRRTVDLDVPGFAKKILKPANTVTQTDVWSAPGADGSRTGQWQVEAKGVPVTMAGTMTLSGSAEGSVEDINGEVSSSIPLIGGMLANFVGGTAERNLADEHTFASKWLAETH